MRQMLPCEPGKTGTRQIAKVYEPGGQIVKFILYSIQSSIWLVGSMILKSTNTDQKYSLAALVIGVAWFLMSLYALID